MRRVLFLLFTSTLLFACGNAASNSKVEQKDVAKAERLVSLNGAITEIIYALGKGDEVVATDITSNYPTEAEKLPKVGHNRNISVEGVLAQMPTRVLGFKNDLDQTFINQVKAAGVDVVLYERSFTTNDVKKVIDWVADEIDAADQSATLKQTVDNDLSKVHAFNKKPKLLFIYARGAGTLMVGGKNTPVGKVIELAGGENAAQNIDGFKPLTSESVVAANPDILVFFDTGFQSLKGWEGLLKVPGIKQTTAGTKKQVITMDGQFLSGFSNRLGKAVQTLNQKIKAIVDVQ